jgi:hypothetical protein
VSYYEIVEWLLKEMDIDIELDHVFAMLDWLFEFQDRMSSSLATVYPLFKGLPKSEGLDESIEEPRCVTWKDQDLSKGDDTYVYFKSYKGSPVSLELSLFK